MDLSGAIDLIERISKTRPVDAPNPTLVCIDGHSAAGKSTVAKALALQFNAAILRGDDFYRVMAEAQRARFSPAQGVDRYYDWERMDTEALTSLAAGRPAVYHPYDWDTGQLSTELKRVDPSPIILVEGVFVSRPRFRHRYSAMILVTTPSSTRQDRQRARADATDAWLQRWEAAERHHLTHISPQEHFDVIVDGAH